MKEIFFDDRWIGPHGIGRFASEIGKRLSEAKKLTSLSVARPSSPFDSLLLHNKLTNNSVFISPGYNPGPIFNNNITSVFTLHDLIHLKHDKNFFKSLYYNTIIKKAVQRSPLIFTVSNYSKSTIVEHFKIDNRKVVVLGNAVSEAFNQEVPAYVHRRPYIFSPTNRRAHKNDLRLLTAYHYSKAYNDYDLIFLGDISDELKLLSNKLKLKSVFFTGSNLHETILASYYKGSSLVCFVSLYEGFGIPILEAMATGANLITSNVTSMPEIAGENTTLINPYDIEEIALAINSKLNQKSCIIKSLSSKQKSWDDIFKTFEENIQQLL